MYVWKTLVDDEPLLDTPNPVTSHLAVKVPCPAAVSIGFIQCQAHIVSVPRIEVIRILGSTYASNTNSPNSTNVLRPTPETQALNPRVV